MCADTPRPSADRAHRSAGGRASSTSRVPPAARPPVRATAAWREGDPVGNRRFADLGPFALESGGRLPAVRLAYETWGTLSP